MIDAANSQRISLSHLAPNDEALIVGVRPTDGMFIVTTARSCMVLAPHEAAYLAGWFACQAGIDVAALAQGAAAGASPPTDDVRDRLGAH